MSIIYAPFLNNQYIGHKDAYHQIEDDINGGPRGVHKNKKSMDYIMKTFIFLENTTLLVLIIFMLLSTKIMMKDMMNKMMHTLIVEACKMKRNIFRVIDGCKNLSKISYKIIYNVNNRNILYKPWKRLIFHSLHSFSCHNCEKDDKL